MLSKTLQDGLNDYGIGRHTWAVAGAALENRGSLLRIALVFGVGLEYFFAGAREQPLVAVTRKSQRVELPERPGPPEAAYRFASLDYPATERRFNCYYAEFLPVAPGKLRPHDHAGTEFIYVIDGTLSLHMNGEEHGLEAGDAIHFDATTPHAYRRSGGRR